MKRRLLLSAMLAPLCAATVRADAPPESMALDVSAMMQMARSGGNSEEKSRFPKFEDVTKDMESTKGMFILWSYPSSAKDKDQEKLLCQIPSSMLGQKFMLSMSFSGGGFFTGFPLDEHVVQWQMLDDQLLLIEPQTHYVIDEKASVSDVVRRTHPDRIRVAAPILTKAPSGDPVIDLGPLLKSNLANIAWMSSMGGPFGGMGGPSGGINSKLSTWTTKKTFELNVEIGTQLAMSRMSPPGSYDKKLVHYSFWKLPPSDYKPRIADERVGYFLTANQDWSRPTDARDLFNRYINRWHLEKRDSSLPLCEPKQPIIFYVEKTVPVRFRRAVRDGILEWNKAFEKIGFVNAVEVRQQTYDNEWKDLDPEDMRYSFFRWIVTGAGFAMGPHRANPFTGQVYDADIIFDDAMVRFYEKAAKRMLPDVAAETISSDPVLTEFFKEFPEWNRPERSWEHFAFGQQEDEEKHIRNALREHMKHRGHVGCDYAHGMKHQMAVAHAVMADATPEMMDGLLYEVIKEVVMHEVGHTLGLRHNFKASTIYSIEEIKQRRAEGKPTTGSVMDYNPLLFFKDEPYEGHFITTTLGPYDYWAIEYGYRPADGTYKGPSDKKDETPDDEDKAESAELAADKPDAGEAGITGDMLDKLPPEIRKIVEANLGKTTSSADSGGAGPANRKGGPAFRGAPSGEKEMLSAIASRAAEPELIYGSDEDTTFVSPDPRAARFDLGSDPIDWAQDRMKLINARLENILEWAVKDGESWYHLRSALLPLMNEKVNLLGFIGKYADGVYVNRTYKGDPNAPKPFELIDPDRQRRALAFVDEHFYQDDFSWVKPEVLNHLAVPRWWHEGTTIDFVADFPIHDVIASMQWWNMFNRFFPNTLRRIHDTELKTDAEDKFTVAEYLKRLQQSCWSEVFTKGSQADGKWTDTKPFISGVRRSLQREYLSMMELLVRTSPGTVMSPDLHAMIQYSLQEIGEKIDGALKKTDGGLDFASRAHLTSSKSRIDRMLSSELREFGGF